MTSTTRIKKSDTTTSIILNERFLNGSFNCLFGEQLPSSKLTWPSSESKRIESLSIFINSFSASSASFATHFPINFTASPNKLVTFIGFHKNGMITYAERPGSGLQGLRSLGLVFGLVLKLLRPSVFFPFETDGQGTRT